MIEAVICSSVFYDPKGHLVPRGSTKNMNLAVGIESVLGMVPPAKMQNKGRVIRWISLDEWLAATAGVTGFELEQQLYKAIK